MNFMYSCGKCQLSITVIARLNRFAEMDVCVDDCCAFLYCMH